MTEGVSKDNQYSVGTGLILHGTNDPDDEATIRLMII